MEVSKSEEGLKCLEMSTVSAEVQRCCDDDDDTDVDGGDDDVDGGDADVDGGDDEVDGAGKGRSGMYGDSLGRWAPPTSNHRQASSLCWSR